MTDNSLLRHTFSCVVSNPKPLCFVIRPLHVYSNLLSSSPTKTLIRKTSKFMGYSSMLTLLFSLVTSLLFQFSQTATVVVDGVSEWKNPQLQIGDCVIFQHKYHYSLYIFKNQEAFTLCNFAQATLLTKPNSTSYIWHTSRPGFFYFSFNNGSNRECLQGQKVAVKVSLAAPPDQAHSPELLPPPLAVPPLPGPHPISRGNVASSPALPWSSHPRDGSSSPSPAPGFFIAATSPMGPYKEGIPFITSNPAVPLPTGEEDTATIHPLPTSGHEHPQQVMEFSRVQKALSCVMLALVWAEI